MRSRGFTLLELIESGNKALIASVDGFDPTRGYRFSTYAVESIRKNIRNDIRKQKDNTFISIPGYLYDYIYKYMDLRKKYQLQLLIWISANSLLLTEFFLVPSGRAVYRKIELFIKQAP